MPIWAPPAPSASTAASPRPSAIPPAATTGHPERHRRPAAPARACRRAAAPPHYEASNVERCPPASAPWATTKSVPASASLLTASSTVVAIPPTSAPPRQPARGTGDGRPSRNVKHTGTCREADLDLVGEWTSARRHLARAGRKAELGAEGIDSRLDRLDVAARQPAPTISKFTPKGRGRSARGSPRSRSRSASGGRPRRGEHPEAAGFRHGQRRVRRRRASPHRRQDDRPAQLEEPSQLRVEHANCESRKSG